jgi:hypothetical protein
MEWIEMKRDHRAFGDGGAGLAWVVSPGGFIAKAHKVAMHRRVEKQFRVMDRISPPDACDGRDHPKAGQASAVKPSTSHRAT